MAKSSTVSVDIRWRVSGSATWSAAKTFKYGKEITIDGLTRNKTYEFEARSRSACGATSAWVSVEADIPDESESVGQDHLTSLTKAGIRSAWTGFSITYVSSDTSATISCTAGTLQDGASNPSYGASSVTVSGSASTTVTYYLYYDDPSGAGGTLTLHATTTYSDLAASQSRVFVGSVDVVYTATGGPSGGGGGSPGGGGGTGIKVL